MISHYYYFDYDKYHIPLHCFTQELLYEYVTNKKAILMRLSGNSFDLEFALENMKNINIILIFKNLEDDIIKLNQVFNDHFKVEIDLKLSKQNEGNNKISSEYLEKDKDFLLKSGLLDDELLIYEKVCSMNTDARFNLNL